MDVAEFYTRPEQTEYTLFSSVGRLSFWGQSATFSVIKAVEARFTQCGLQSNLTYLGFRSDGAFLPVQNPVCRIEIIGEKLVFFSGNILPVVLGRTISR